MEYSSQDDGFGPEMDWVRIGALAKGCRDEYIQKTAEQQLSPTFGQNRASMVGPRVTTTDPVHALQEGLPVLFWVSGTGLRQRVLKVDNRLSFCFIMSASPKEKLTPQVLPLCQVTYVHGHAEAVDLCHRLGIHDTNITPETTVVAQTKMRSNEDEPTERDVWIFVAPPRTALQERLLACSISQSKYGVMGRGRGTIMQATAEEGTTKLDGLRLRDPLTPYYDVKSADLELQFSGAHTNRPMTHKVKLPISLWKVPDEIQKLEKRTHGFTPIDKARVRHALREIIVINQWAQHFRSTFQEDLISYTQKVASKSQEPFALEQSSEQGVDEMDLVYHPPSTADEDHYSKVLLTAVLKSLQQMLELSRELMTRLRRVDMGLHEANAGPDGVFASEAESLGTSRGSLEGGTSRRGSIFLQQANMRGGLSSGQIAALAGDKTAVVDEFGFEREGVAEPRAKSQARRGASRSCMDRVLEVQESPNGRTTRSCEGWPMGSPNLSMFSLAWKGAWK